LYPKDYHFLLSRESKSLNESIPQVWYTYEQVLKEKYFNRNYNPIFGVKAIAIHATVDYYSSGAMSIKTKGN